MSRDDEPQKPQEGASPQAEQSFPHTVLQSFVFAARLHGAELSVGRLVHDHALSEAEPTLNELAKIAGASGFKARAVNLDYAGLAGLGQVFPLVARLKNGNGVVIVGVRESGGVQEVGVVDPLADRPGVIMLPYDRFTANWGGEVLLLKKVYRVSDEKQPFGLKWFIPEILRQKRLFIDVALAALILPVVGLAQPLFFQLVIDKVLVHQGFTTLYVLVVGIVAATLFEGAFGFIRQFMLLFATRRIDIRVAQRTFAHLLSLPLDFFERRYAGVLVKHMQQTEKIRNFLTGRLFLTVLDSVALFVFVPVLFFYSSKLTFVVLLFAGLISLVIASLIKPFQRRLKELYLAEGDRQAYLVENIHGMRTVKSLAVEPKQKRDWDDKAALTVNRSFKVGMISAVAGNLTKILQGLMTISVIAVGALDVFSGAMTVGALVAFNMLSGRVTGPLVSMVSLIHEYQETALSVRMLGEVMNAPPERASRAAALRPAIKGGIKFETVTFNYPGANTPALDRVDLAVSQGTVLGIVGRSGSGKTTLTRLLQGLYHPNGGMIRIDGVDIREMDVAHLRRNIGVVLQEDFLFRGSIRDNIAVGKTDATFAQIRTAAQLAGAEEFIERLPHGYDTRLEEGASNLSGGQKQRLAIARALLVKPRILIFDEATSALDPESEAIIKRNLKLIAEGRTLLMVSHRLTNLVDSDAICVMDQGKIVCYGKHAALLKECPIYAHLWRQQVGDLAD